jgi:hypothetical protein
MPNSDDSKRPERLKIIPFAKQEGGDTFNPLPEITVLFNPESYSIAKSVSWGSATSSGGGGGGTQRKVNAPILTFGGGESRQLTLELFFDVTQPIQSGGKPATLIQDVREETNKIVTLTRIERGEEHPRVCRVFWGDAPIDSDFPFTGVITSLTQKFTMFKPDGRPVRATLSITLKEFLDPALDQRKTDPELTTRIIRRGDTLSKIAAELYQDPTRWRTIADANRLSDPRNLDALIGKTLTIPKLR